MPVFFAPPRLRLDFFADVLRLAPPVFFAEPRRTLVLLPPLVFRALELFFALPLFRLLVLLPPDFLLLLFLRVAIHFIRTSRANGPTDGSLVFV